MNVYLFLFLLIIGITNSNCMEDDLLQGERPREHFCPITLCVMEDPVVAVDGYSYERSAIENWFRTNRRSPMTNNLLLDFSLRPNFALRSLINDWGDAQRNPISPSDIPVFNPNEYPLPGENDDDNPGKCKGMCMGIRSLFSS